jgi:hypothetical protein
VRSSGYHTFFSAKTESSRGAPAGSNQLEGSCGKKEKKIKKRKKTKPKKHTTKKQLNQPAGNGTKKQTYGKERRANF